MVAQNLPTPVWSGVRPIVSFEMAFEFRFCLVFESTQSADGGLEQSSGIVAEPYRYLRPTTPDLSTKSGASKGTKSGLSYEIRNVSPR